VETYATLLSEALRPQVLTDITLPDRIRTPLEKMIRTGSIQNLLFYGGPGIGKTSAARVILKELNANVYEFNGSYNNGDKTMVDKIETFAHSMSLVDGPKVVFIDEADYLTKKVQAGLRNIIENTSKTTRYIFTANEIRKLTPAIQSRFTCICFDLKKADQSGITASLAKKYQQRLRGLGYRISARRVREILEDHYPDLRSVANWLQMELA